MTIQTILFDFDYTLADSSKGVCICVNHALSRMGFPKQPLADICRTIGFSLPETYLSLTNSDNEKDAEVFRDLFTERADEVMAEYTFILDGVPEALRELTSQGMTLGIVSTKYRYRITHILKREELLHHFDVIVGGEDVESHKPDPEGLLLALSRLSASHRDCLYVGDSVVDGELARRGGVRFAAVCSGVTESDELQRFSPDYTLGSVENLPGLINQDP